MKWLESFAMPFAMIGAMALVMLLAQILPHDIAFWNGGVKMDNNNSNNYINKTHTYGKIWTLVTLALFLSVPVLICAHLGVSPKLEMIGKGLATVALVFYPTAVLEVITYSPMLGTGGTYLGFVTGNITNLKLPVALNAMESAEVEPGSEEGEVISTISIAVSSIVTTIIIAVCVLAFSRCFTI